MAENGSEASDISQSSDPNKEEEIPGSPQEKEDQQAEGRESGGLPRRSSLIKDSARKRSRKKTVSFSSFPEEKTISKGESGYDILILNASNIRCFENWNVYIFFFIYYYSLGPRKMHNLKLTE